MGSRDNVVSRIEVVMIAKTTSKLRYWTFGLSLVSQVFVAFCIYAKTCHLLILTNVQFVLEKEQQLWSCFRTNPSHAWTNLSMVRQACH